MLSKTLSHLTILTFALASLAVPDALAFSTWDAGGSGDNFNTASNWDDTDFPGFEFVPGPANLAVHDNAGGTANLPAILIDSDAGSTANDVFSGMSVQGVDSLRLSQGGGVNHTAGTLNITNSFFFDFFEPPASDNGLWIGETGTRTFDGGAVAPSVYTLNGGVIDIADTQDSLQIGRSWDPENQNNYAEGRLDFLAGSVTSAGDATIGLDGFAEWNQSGGVYNGGNTYVGRFASPEAITNLSGNASWNINGSLLLADQQTLPDFRVGRSDGAGTTQFNLTGSNVSVSTSNGLFFRGNAAISYIADADGVSPIVSTGGTVEFSDQNLPGNRPDLSVDLSAAINVPASATVTLVDASSLALGQFQDLPEGTAVPNSGGRVITYRGGIDGFDVQLVPADSYVPPPPLPTPPDAIIGRWSMNDRLGTAPADPDNVAFQGNPAVFDQATGSFQGVLAGNPADNGGVASNVDHLWFFSADNGHDYVSSNNVPPTSMFVNGNDAGSESYDAASVLESFSEGALFFPQDIYGNEFSLDGSFSVEAFFRTSDGENPQQIIVQGEGFGRYGLSMNDGSDGSLRFSVSDGVESETGGLFNTEFIEIGGTTGIGTDYADGEWHYVLATFEEDAGANGTGQLTIAVADEDGSTAISSLDLSADFLGLPPAFNDGNFLVGAVDFNGQGVTDMGTIGPIDPKRFDGLIDEVQISRGLISASDRLGFLDLPEPVLAGDYNNDGVVDAADYTVWRDGGPLLNETVTPGMVTQEDYDAWALNYGANVATTAVSVPEPSGLMVLAAALALFGATAHRTGLA